MGRKRHAEVEAPGPGDRWAAWPAIVCVLALPACSEPTFHFRGYSERSSCRGVIDSELAAGARFSDALDEELPDGPGIVTELAGSVLAVPVTIDIACYPDGRVSYVDYVATAGAVEQSTQVYETFFHELDRFFGEAAEDSVPGRRSRTYLCDGAARVTLRQTQLAQTSYEVSLLVIPHATEC